MLNFCSLGWCTQREGWWRARTFVLASAITWTSSREFPLLTFLEGLKNQSVTLAGTVGRLIEILTYWTLYSDCQLKGVMMLCCSRTHSTKKYSNKSHNPSSQLCQSYSSNFSTFFFDYPGNSAPYCLVGNRYNSLIG